MIRNLLVGQKNLEKIAIIDDDKVFTYKDLIHKTTDIQNSLPKPYSGNIAIFLPNTFNFIASLYGLFMLNITAFPLHCYMTKHEIIPFLEQAHINIIITSIKFKDKFEHVQNLYEQDLHIIYVEEIQTTNHEINITNDSIKSDNPLIMLTTSGSTGKNRIVPLSEENISASVLGYLDKMNFDKKDSSNVRYILSSPFTSAYGLMILFACLTNSFPLILLKEGFTIDGFYKTAQNHLATHYEGGASVLLIMEQTINKAIPYNISLLKHFGFGGSKISGNTLRKLSIAFPEIKFWQGYGMTEASPLITKYSNNYGEKLDSVGTAIKNVTILIDSIDGITDREYIKGEIIVKGPNVMCGYYNDKQSTDNILKKGYLYTGDIGYLDDQGYLYICGRKKSIIIVQGLNVHPEEIESCLLDSLLIKECLVYGETDLSGNEIICADVVTVDKKINIQKIHEYCSKHLAPYKNPTRITIVSEIEKVASGKINRAQKV